MRRAITVAPHTMSRRATKHEFTRNPATGILDAPAGEAAYAWDGWTLAAEFTPSTGAAVRRYVWNPSGRGGHRSLAAVRLGGGTGASASPPAQFAVVDANANVSLLLNGASGAASPGGGAPEMSAVYEYGPFGEPLRATGPLAKANPVRFSSELLDTATGCYYYGYRYYHPDTGRWLSRDPIGELGGVNLYGFVGNNPISKTDRLGLMAVVRPDSSGNCPRRCCSRRGPAEQLVPIWLCTRKLGGNGPAIMPIINHKYLCCDSPTEKCYGVTKYRPSCMNECRKEGRPESECKEECFAKKGSPIEKESRINGTCETRCVRAEEKQNVCNGRQTMPEDYRIDGKGIDCQEWAKSSTMTTCRFRP